MRCEDDVVHLPERMPLRQRLDLEYIEPRSSDLADLKRGRQVGKVYDSTATNIYQVRAPFHLLELRPPEELDRLRCMRRRDYHKIAFCQQLRQAVQSPQPRHTFGRLGLHRVDRKDSHLESPAAASNLRADAAQADNAQGLITEMKMRAIDRAYGAWSGSERHTLGLATDRFPAT